MNWHQLRERHVVEHRAGRGTTARRSRDRPSRCAAGWRAPSRRRAAASRARVAYCCAQRLPAPRGWPRRTPAGSPPSRFDTTSTARDASSTWTTGPLYSGAIFTAVCCWLVVAPPISSGTVKPRRVISLRDEHHLVERRRDQAAQADDVRLLLDRGVEDLRRRHHHAEVDDLVVVAAEHDADDVLADVVDVPLDRRHQDAALRRAASAPFSRSM